MGSLLLAQQYMLLFHKVSKIQMISSYCGTNMVGINYVSKYEANNTEELAYIHSCFIGFICVNNSTFIQ